MLELDEEIHAVEAIDASGCTKSSLVMQWEDVDAIRTAIYFGIKIYLILLFSSVLES